MQAHPPKLKAKANQNPIPKQDKTKSIIKLIVSAVFEYEYFSIVAINKVAIIPNIEAINPEKVDFMFGL